MAAHGRPLPTRLREFVERRGLWLLVGVLMAALAGAYWHVQLIQEQVVHSLAENGARLQAEALTELRSLYTADVVERVRQHGIQVRHDYRQVDGAIPLPATLTLTLAERINASSDDLYVRLYSDYPFPWRTDGGPRDTFEREALRALQVRPEQPIVSVESYDGRLSVRYAVADRMRKECLACHNSHPDSPKRDWRENDVRGVLEVVRHIDTAAGLSRGATQTAFGALALVALLVVIAVVLLFNQRRQLAHELEQQVQQRTEQLRAANAELEQFAYVASHDLQEPLRMISNYLQLVDRRYQKQLDHDAREFIGFAVDGAKRMQQLINDLLHLSRLGTRAKTLAPVDGERLLADVKANLRLAITETGAVISHDPMPVLYGDDTQLLQLFQNLLGNALKFHGEAAPIIHISVQREGMHYHFSIKDNGIGIEAEHFERVFGIFQRLHTRERYAGTGIGLAVARKIVERHGGQIWLESTLGVGTTFHFTLAMEATT